MNKEERIAARVTRSKKNSRVAITPFPISNAVFGDVKGRVLSYLFPCDGTITKGVIRVGKKIKGLNLAIMISDELTSATKTFTLDERYVKVTPNLEVKAGDMLSMSITSEEIVEEFWVSFLWVPTENNIARILDEEIV